MRVCHNIIGGPRVQSSSGGSAPSIGCVLLHTGMDNGSFRLFPFPSLSQLCYGPVVTYCIVYHYTKRAMLTRLLANEDLAIYVVHLNRYFVIPP